MKCPICNSTSISSLKTLRRGFYHCRYCGFYWADPASYLDEGAARARYERHNNSPENRAYREYLERIIDRALDWARHDTIPGTEPRTILDWGSGPNSVCSLLLRDRSYSTLSWDPLFAPGTKPDACTMDLILSIEVAEHFTAPVASFRDLASCLRHGGKALIHTHLAPQEEDKFLAWWYIEDPTHVSFYSRESLHILAEYASLKRPVIEEDRFCLFTKPLPILVVGGANIDVEGRPHKTFISRDSNPGTLHLSRGGSARNGAENLAILDMGVELVTVLGDDGLGKDLLRETAEQGVGVSGIIILPGEKTSMYLSILDADGDMVAAISGMDIYESLREDAFLEGLERAVISVRERSYGSDPMQPFSAILIDGNIRPVFLEVLLDRFSQLAVWFDPVSTSKAKAFGAYKAASLLSRLFCIKPNLVEALALLNMEGEDAEGPIRKALAAALGLNEHGVKRSLISLGSAGLLCMDEGIASLIRTPPLEPVSATGVGDAAIAGALRAELLGLSPTEGALRACAAASITLQEPLAVASHLDSISSTSLCLWWEQNQMAHILTDKDGWYDTEG